MPIISGGGGGGGLGNVTLTGTPASGQVPVASAANAAAWGYPPGFEIGYDQITASATVTGTTEGTATTIITCAAHTFDGGAVSVEWFGLIAPKNTAGSNIRVGLFEGGTLVNVLAFLQTPAAAITEAGHKGGFRFTPSAASHSYVVAAWGAANCNVDCGAGGAGNLPPAWVRFTKV